MATFAPVVPLPRAGQAGAAVADCTRPSETTRAAHTAAIATHVRLTLVPDINPTPTSSNMECRKLATDGPAGIGCSTDVRNMTCPPCRYPTGRRARTSDVRGGRTASV